MHAVIERLKSLPDEAQDAIAPQLYDYLTKHDELHALIQEGLDSGPSREIDFEAIKRRGRERLAGSFRMCYSNHLPV